MDVVECASDDASGELGPEGPETAQCRHPYRDGPPLALPAADRRKPRMPDDLAPSELNTALEREDGRPVLRVEGEVDLLTTPVLVEALDAALTGDAALVVDLEAVEFMDSTGLRALLEARRRAEDAGGGLQLRLRDGGPVARLLDLAGVRDLFGR